MGEPITTIKSGTKNYPVHKGDYLIDNGACLQFTAVGPTPLYRQNLRSYWTVPVSKKTFKAYIEFYNLQPVIVGDVSDRITRYYF